MRLSVITGLLMGLLFSAGCSRMAGPVSPQRMQAIHEAVKTPFKYGVVLEAPEGKKIDCPTVFRHNGKWYMIYVQFEKKPKEGYTTQLAASDDLLHWAPLGTIGERGEEGRWDHANVAGGPALIDTRWAGSYELETWEDKYWFSYIGGDKYGYESIPLSIGLAYTTDPTQSQPWDKLPKPVMTTHDPDAREGQETATLYKSFIFRDKTESLGAPFVMFYNAKGRCEQIFTAVSDDMKTWRRFGDGPAVENWHPANPDRGVITGDPQITKIGDMWVMFYFGAFWKPGAFDTFACSRDLAHWTKWQGANLIAPSEPWDKTFAHKPWVLKHDGIVYHFYCAVGDRGRCIALATSQDLRNMEQ